VPREAPFTLLLLSSSSSWCSQMADPPQSLHLLLMRWHLQMADPPQSLHVLLCRWCSQMPDPPQSLHVLLMRWCSQMRQDQFPVGRSISLLHAPVAGSLNGIDETYTPTPWSRGGGGFYLELLHRSRMEWGYSGRTSGSDIHKISQCAVRLTCGCQECVAWLETRF
jgi:hypothetical protein